MRFTLYHAPGLISIQVAPMTGRTRGGPRRRAPRSPSPPHCRRRGREPGPTRTTTFLTFLFPGSPRTSQLETTTSPPLLLLTIICRATTERTGRNPPPRQSSGRGTRSGATRPRGRSQRILFRPLRARNLYQALGPRAPELTKPCSGIQVAWLPP